MKKIILLLLIFPISIGIMTPGLRAQKIKETKIPSAIIKDFKLKFPDAQKVKWKKVESLYFAQFLKNGKGVDVTYESNGNWVETMTEISTNEIPAEVVTGVSNLLAGAKIVAAATINQFAKETLYIVQLRFKGKKAEMTLDSKGNQVS